jgi:hypothetical protein
MSKSQTLRATAYSFSDLSAKLADAQNVATLYANQVAVASEPVARAAFVNATVNKACRTVINAHGKFYGLRSKYDGRGNKREPLTA